MITKAVADVLASAELGLSFGANLFVGKALGSKYIVVLSGQTGFHLDDDKVRHSKVRVLVHGYSASAGHVIAMEIIKLVSAMNGVYVAEGISFDVKSVTTEYFSEYLSYTDNQREYSLNFTINYTEGA